MNKYNELEEAPFTQSRREFVRLSDSELEQLFNLGPIRNEVHQYLREEDNKTWAIQEGEFLDADSNKRAQWLFSTHLLGSFGISLALVDHLLRSTPPPMQLEMLTQKRTELISKFAGTNAGKHWMMCMKMKDGWKYVAQYTDGDNGKLNLAETEAFLATLDHISIIHDLIKGRGRKYGLDFKVINTENVAEFKKYCKHPDKAHLILDLLHKHIDGKDSPKRSMRPIRAAIEAGVIEERPNFAFVEKEFGEHCQIDKSSYYTYTDMTKGCPYDDTLYSELVDTFEKFK